MKAHSCPHCGQPMPGEGPTPEQLERVLAEIHDRGIELAPGDFLTEADTATLLGISASGLRKRVELGTNQLPYSPRGNRRVYRLEHVAMLF